MSASPRKRGVYIRYTVGGAIRISATASDEREIAVLVVDAAIYQDRMVRGMEKLLDRADPQLKIVRQD